MKLLQTAAISALLLAGCAPYQHGHFAKDASFVGSGAEAPGTPVLINSKIDPFYEAAVAGGHQGSGFPDTGYGPTLQHADHSPVDDCGISFGCAAPAPYQDQVYASPAVHTPPVIQTAQVHAPVYQTQLHHNPVYTEAVPAPTVHVEPQHHYRPPHRVEVAQPYIVPEPIHPPVEIQQPQHQVYHRAAPVPEQRIAVASTVSAPTQVIRMPTVYAPPEVINMPPVYLRAQGIQAQPFPDPPYPGQQAHAAGFPASGGGFPHQYGPPPPPYGPQPANARCVTSCGGTTY